MKKRDKEAQFATAWVADDRQILCYVWHEEAMGYYVVHLSQDPTLRLAFNVEFEGPEKAWTYFEGLRSSRDEARQLVENIFEGLFEAKGKEYAEEEVPSDAPLS